MRVIAGDKRGLVLFSPSDEAVRPTSDKIKGAIFNSLQNRLPEVSVFVDVFGGSGAMGIEALSRGVDRAWFFDTAKASINLINKNLNKAGYTDRARVLHMSAAAGLDRMAAAGVTGDLFFMDPPYRMGDAIPELMTKIFHKKLLNRGGIIVIEHEKNVIIPKVVCGFELTREKTYGITCISMYEAIDEE